MFSGAQAGVSTPNSFGAASASAARNSARSVSSVVMTSATSAWTCGNCSIPMAWVSSETRPRMYSVLAVVRVTT